MNNYKIGDLVENQEKAVVMRDGAAYHIEKNMTLRVTGVQGDIFQTRCHFDDFGPLYFTEEEIVPALMTCF